VLSGEILEDLLDKSRLSDKNEIDGLVMAGLTGTGRRQSVLGTDHCRRARARGRLLRAVHTGGCSAAGCVARAAAAIDYGMCEVAFLLFADTHVLEDRPTTATPTARMDRPYGLMGRPARSACSAAPTRRNTASTTGCWASSR
jgi:hypothetical protein